MYCSFEVTVNMGLQKYYFLDKFVFKRFPLLGGWTVRKVHGHFLRNLRVVFRRATLGRRAVNIILALVPEGITVYCDLCIYVSIFGSSVFQTFKYEGILIERHCI